ncbi:hypothetical protein FRB99_000898 [Tulasnella sp. 403]|nr:hypothetical protein FRB99_000898 [Tulasnella sp. 403]
MDGRADPRTHPEPPSRIDPDTTPCQSDQGDKPRDETSERSGDGSPHNNLYEVPPCWNLDDIIGEGLTCPKTTVPRSLGAGVLQKVMGQVQAMLMMFQIDSNPRRLQRAIHLLDHVIPLLSDNASLVASLCLQGNCRWQLFNQTREPSLLDMTINVYQTALGLQAWDFVSHHTVLKLCGMAFAERYGVSGGLGDLDRGIELLRGAFGESVETTESPAPVVARLGDLLVKRHRRTWDGKDLSEGIDFLSKAVSLLAVTNDPDRPAVLNNLGCALVTHYDTSGKILDVEEAISHHRKAISLRPENHPDRPSSLSNLAGALITRYKKLGDTRDVEEAVVCAREALSFLTVNHPDQSTILNNLASALITRYERLGKTSDLNDGIDQHCKALSLRSGNHPDRPTSLNSLAAALTTRYKKLGGTSDVEEAVARVREALSLLSDNHPDRSTGLSNLGAALIARYQALGDLADVEEGIDHHHKAISLRSGCHPERPTSLNNLASALITRYERSGKTADIEMAIVYHREALSLRSGNHPDRSTSLNNLANALVARHLKSGSISDLDEAIALLETACKPPRPDDPQQSTYIHNLANLLLKRKKDVEDLHEAIRLYEKVLSLQPDNNPDRPATLESLGRAHLTRRLNALDVETGMRFYDEALSLSPRNSPHRQIALINLFLMMPSSYYSETDKVDLLNRCVDLAKLTPPEDKSYSKMTSSIAPILYSYHDIASELLAALGLDSGLKAEDAILALLQKGSQSPASPPRDQLRSTCDWITFSKKSYRPCTLEMYGIMLDHLDLAVARGCSLDIRRLQISNDVVLRQARDMVPDAVAFAIKLGEIETAVEFLERGRSILLTQLSMNRVSSGLEAAAPYLAARFNNLSWQVECATFGNDKGLVDTEVKHPFEDPISRSDRLRGEWVKVVQDIRALEGLQHFLRPIPFADLKKAATEGPVIFLNISELRSDAVIILSNRPPIVVPLPNAKPENVNLLVNAFELVAKSKMGNDIRGPLRDLWEEVVGPIASALEAMDGVVPKGSRIWWCPSSSLTTLPLHAAGDYHGIGGGRLPDLYISSYTPTLTALSRARQGWSQRSGVPRLLLVGQSHTPGQKPLPAVPKEIARVKKRMPHVTVIEDGLGTCDAVLSAVMQHQWVHLSCHGKVEKTNPLQSHFALHDGPLTLHELMQNRSPLAELAFLSCCHSASGKSTIPDEFLHLATGMQFAGFKSVVGTMWAMDDAVGPLLADEFYRRIVKWGNSDYRQSAKSLNDALKVLRSNKVHLSIWINFVHWGI